MDIRLFSFFVGTVTIFTALVSNAQIVFEDDFESGLDNWAASGTWGLTTVRHASPNHSAADSPGGFYDNNSDTSLTMAPFLDLTGLERPMLAFHHLHFLETDYDFGRVEISTDGGATWHSQPLAEYTGSLSDWQREYVDLSAHASETDVRLRFRLVTDASVVMEGWFIDDVVVGEAPKAVELDAPEGDDIERNAITLRWSEAGTDDFAAYRIYRSRESGIKSTNATLVGEITSASETTFTDIRVSPKTRYSYRVAVITAGDLATLSNEVTALTPAGMDYPFLDDGGAGPNAWVATAPWALSDQYAYSGTHAWADSPYAEYENNIASQPLTLAAPVDLSAADTPVLSFVHRHTFASGDTGNVEISTDEGGSWTTLAAYGTGTSDWRRERFDLSDYAAEPSVLIRFRLTTDSAHTAEGWYIDNISLAESPTVVPAPAIDEVGSHSMRLTWAANTDSLFSHYAVHRSTSPDVGIQSPLAGTVSNQNAPAFTDTGLALDTVYYYRVYAVSPYGTYSPHSDESSSAQTLNNPLPFADHFSEGLQSWNVTGMWGLTATHSHSGEWSLTDSPETMHHNNASSSATTAVDLRGSEWPVLTFHERHDFGTGDRGYVAVSTDGSNWTDLYSVSGGQSEWSETRLDLSDYRDAANLRIRFTLTADNDGDVGDGWFIDTVSVAEHEGGLQSLPFRDDFTAGLDNWITGGWTTREDNEALLGGHVLADSADDAPWSSLFLHLGKEVDLTEAVDPQIVFWYRGNWAPRHRLRLQVSEDGGLSWDTTNIVGTSSTVTVSEWTRHQQSLADYAGKTIRLRLYNYLWGFVGYDHTGRVDSLTVQERPAAVTQETPVPSVRSVALSWTQSDLPEFARYEVYRRTSAGVTPAHTHVATVTDPAQTTFTDTSLSVGQTYFYSVFVVNTDEVYSAGTERQTVTVPVAFPVADEMNTLAHWMPGGDWGIQAGGGMDGGNALASNPDGDYAPSEHTSVLTAVDLSDTQWPVLTLRERYEFGTNDRGYVDVSTDGSSWTEIYSVSGTRTAWEETQLDLSAYRDQSNLRIRFRIQTHSNNDVGDGWRIDHVAIAEHGGGLQSLPFRDDFTGGLDNWITGGWTTREDSEALLGGHVLADSADDAPWSSLFLHLGKELDLTEAVDPQIVFWYRGEWAARHRLRLQVSEDGGLSWDTTNIVGSTSSETVGEWTRHQQSLADYTGETVRLRLNNYLWGFVGYDHTGRVDALTVQERPAAVTQETPVPSVRSVALSWTQGDLPEFVRYEVYRRTSAGVTPAHTHVATITDPTQTTFTDTGLSVGQTYFYSVFVVNTDEVYSEGTERQTVTVPVAFPVEDEMNTLDRWMPGGDWAIQSGGGMDGGNALASNPDGDYAPSEHTSVLTAVDLSDTQWPVLTLRERCDFGTDDRGYVDVSPDGSSWTEIYSVSGTRVTWEETQLDLSAYRDQSNLRIRFRIRAHSNSDVGDGWRIDQVAIAEHPGGLQSLPFREDFTGGLDNWITGGWTTREDSEALLGGHVLADSADDAPWSSLFLHLGKKLDLTEAVDPQIVFWYRGDWAPRHRLRLQVSEDGGLSWDNTNIVGATSTVTVDEWTRHQQSLADYAGKTIRLRLDNYLWGFVGYDHTGRIDALTVQERPAAATLLPASDIGVASITLEWEQAPLDDFASYRVYRAGGPNVSETSTLVAEITDPEQTMFTDIGLQARTNYHYRVFTWNGDSVSSGSNTVSATTLAVEIPWSEDFTAGLIDNWTVTGTWQVVEGLGEDDSPALVDAIGDYSPSSNTYAQTALNLAPTEWPVLELRDRHDLGNGDYGYIEISTNNGSTWTTVYALRDTRADWTDTRIDLSPFRQSDSVWVRFRLVANSDSSVGDGWRIDHLAVVDHSPDTVPAFMDDFTGDLGRWIASAWNLHDSEPFTGSHAVRDNPFGSSSSEATLVYGDTIDLAEVEDPMLTYWVRANTPLRYSFATQVSTDGGVSWTTLPGTSFANTDIPEWTRYQVDLADYRDEPFRLRFRSNVTTGWRNGTIEIDRVGLGGPEPGAPSLLSPEHNETVEVFRPVLIVGNAIDYQNDPLNYHFEVYADAALTQLVAQVPSVASGSTQTSWQVDVNLIDNAPYWWRVRAFDADNYGEWSETGVFNVNETNTPPYPVVIAGPPNGTLLLDPETRLFWYPTNDPDVGDTILDYHIQIARDDDFETVVVDVPEIEIPEDRGDGFTASFRLRDLAGAEFLTAGPHYWRIRARDSRYSHSAWSDGLHWFEYPSRFQRWRYTAFSHREYIDSSVSGPLADANRDGLPNILKYLHGTPPAESQMGERPVSVILEDGGERYLGIEFILRRDHGLDLRYEASVDAVHWFPTVGTLEILENLDAETDRVRFRELEPTTDDRRFIRFRVDVP